MIIDELANDKRKTVSTKQIRDAIQQIVDRGVAVTSRKLKAELGCKGGSARLGIELNRWRDELVNGQILDISLNPVQRQTLDAIASAVKSEFQGRYEQLVASLKAEVQDLTDSLEDLNTTCETLTKQAADLERLNQINEGERLQLKERVDHLGSELDDARRKADECARELAKSETVRTLTDASNAELRDRICELTDELKVQKTIADTARLAESNLRGQIDGQSFRHLNSCVRSCKSGPHHAESGEESSTEGVREARQ